VSAALRLERATIDGRPALCCAPRDARLEARALEWLAAERAADGIELKRGRVFRVERLVVKFFARERRPWRVWREAPALRSARAHARELGVRVPRPILAIGRRNEPSLLVTDFVAGPSLAEAWLDEPAARAALPTFLAAMHRRGVFHGDLHPRNVLWDGEALVLLDLIGLRHVLRTLPRTRLAHEQWAQLGCRLDWDPRLRTAFASYCAAMGQAARSEARWLLVRRAGERIQARRASHLSSRTGLDASRTHPPA
jgi:hypothetical protein